MVGLSFRLPWQAERSVAEFISRCSVQGTSEALTASCVLGTGLKVKSNSCVSNPSSSPDSGKAGSEKSIVITAALAI